MKLSDFIQPNALIDLSFFNFRNAITACYMADDNLRILRVNEQFKKFFPILRDVTNAYFPNILNQIGVPETQIQEFEETLKREGKVLIPRIKLMFNGHERLFSLLSTKTHDDQIPYLNGVQGQFVDRTEEWKLRKETEELLEQKLKNRVLIEEKTLQLENLANKLAKYLSPQIYQSIFLQNGTEKRSILRKPLTIFFSDIVCFTDLSDTLEPEQLAKIINSYLSEMSSIAIDKGGTIDKFIGDAVLVFFGDPESMGEEADALACIDMAITMQNRIREKQKFWEQLGAYKGLKVRMGITSGYCTVGNFGSDQRLDYTVLGSPVNLAARLQGLATPGKILVSEATQKLIKEHIRLKKFSEITPKGFSRPTQTFEIVDFLFKRNQKKNFEKVGKRVEVNIFDKSDITAALIELKEILKEFEYQIPHGTDNNKIVKRK